MNLIAGNQIKNIVFIVCFFQNCLLSNKIDTDIFSATVSTAVQEHEQNMVRNTAVCLHKDLLIIHLFLQVYLKNFNFFDRLSSYSIYVRFRTTRIFCGD